MGASKGGKSRFVLAGLVSCLTLLATAPVAAASGEGVISGKVTSALTHAGIENLEVRAYKSENVWYALKTGKGGEYSSAVEAGEYKVEFNASSTQYATQYYDEKLSYAAAKMVKVEEGGETKEVNAALFKNASISGEVTSASTNLELGDIEVTAYEKNAPNAVVTSVDTNGFGKYDLTDLSRGAYAIRFRPVGGSGLDYAPRFYKEVARFSEASEVYVDESNESDINAKLVKGAAIAGVVMDAATHQPLPGIIVYAISLGAGEPVSFAITNANGGYELVGMASGTVEVAFLSQDKEGEVPYLPQLYDGQALPETISGFTELLPFGTHVEVSAQLTTPGIDAAMVREEPANTVAPTASGGASVGQALSCTTGSWTGIGTLTYTYQWLRDGSAIPGAGSNTYVVQTADQGHGLACKVTASNEIGNKKEIRNVSAISNTLTVPSPANGGSSSTSLPVPVLVFSSSKLVVSGSSVQVPVDCEHASCTGTIELTEQLVVKHRKGKKTVSKKETLVLAKGSYSLLIGHSATIDVHLTAAGKSALAKAKDHRLSAKLSASVAGGTTVKEPVALSRAVKAKHKAKPRTGVR